MSEIALVGDKNSILGFKALGISIFPAETKEEVISLLRTLIQEEFKIIFITEQFAPDAETITDEMSGRTTPVIMMIPNNRSAMGLRTERMRELVRKAAGADILGQKD